MSEQEKFHALEAENAALRMQNIELKAMVERVITKRCHNCLNGTYTYGISGYECRTCDEQSNWRINWASLEEAGK